MPVEESCSQSAERMNRNSIDRLKNAHSVKPSIKT